jgi:hypothetical protein
MGYTQAMGHSHIYTNTNITNNDKAMGIYASKATGHLCSLAHWRVVLDPHVKDSDAAVLQRIHFFPLDNTGELCIIVFIEKEWESYIDSHNTNKTHTHHTHQHSHRPLPKKLSPHNSVRIYNTSYCLWSAIGDHIKLALLCAWSNEMKQKHLKMNSQSHDN